jgi:tetratricopeptide (TPR) repeat protein
MRNFKNIFIATLVVLFCSSVSFAQKEVKLLRQGNKQYEKGEYKDAEISYRKSFETKNDYYKGYFNLGDALYKQEKYDEAANYFSKIVQSDNVDKKVKAEAYHNLGNCLLQQKKYQESIDAYKNSLKMKPEDKDTKYNLEYARKKIIQQQKQQQQNQQNQNQNQDKKDDKKDKNDKNDKNKDKQDQQQQQQQGKVSKQDAERMLNALKNKEKQTQEKLDKVKEKNVNSNIEKDW